MKESQSLGGKDETLFINVIQKSTCSVQIAQLLKVPVAKPDNLSFLSRTNIVERENLF